MSTTTETTDDTGTTMLDAAVDQARADVEEQRSRLAQWEAKLAAAQHELESIQDRAGAELLEDPDAEEHIATTIAQLQARITLARKAITAQRPRIVHAESAYLAAEADRLEAPLVEVQARIEAHEAKTAKLLAQLEAHDGPYVTEKRLVQEQRSQNVVWAEGPPVMRPPKSERMRAEALAGRRQVQVLRELAAGRDPRPMINGWIGVSKADVYPECVQGPDALVHTPAYLDSVTALRERIEELEQARDVELPGRLAEHERTAAIEDPQSQDTYVGAQLRHRLASIDGELVQARADLAALTGSEA